MQPLVNIAVNAARLAGDIILRHMESVEHLKISTKGQHDFCSEVDLKAEQAIIQTILKAYPDHGFIAEERGVVNPNAECVWIIDPLDGTSNYLHGFPFYAVSIAIQIKNQVEHAVIYDPIRHEFFSASRGRGARLNDRRIRVSKQQQLSACLLAAGLQEKHQLNPQTNQSLQAVFDQCASVRRTGSIALELAYIASGRLDGLIGFDLKPWDIAAGCLLIQEAGGLLSDAQGQADYLKSGSLIAGNPKIFAALQQALTISS
jgi:myo-inositol-1(or 4)-monophosphatase